MNSTMNQITITFYPTGKSPVFLTCEVAATYSKKIKGLMNRSSLPADRGMLFSFWFSWYRIFWMKNVTIPLDIIFINKKCKVVSIKEAPANVGFFHKEFWALGFGKYVIECNRGFCQQHQISVGTTINISKS